MKAADKTTVGLLAGEAVAKCLQKVESYEASVIQNQNPEDLHQMRVNLRRLRTAMQVFSAGIRLPKGGNEAQVAKVARCLGQLRDLDVISITLRNQYGPDLPDAERDILEGILVGLAKRQRKVHKQVKKMLKGDRYRTLKSRLNDWGASPDCNAIASLDIQTVLPDLMLPLMSRLWLQPAWLIGTKISRGVIKPDLQMSTEAVDALVLEYDEQIHDLRKQAKRVRYQLKFVSEYYGDRLDAPLTQLAELQEVLGALQDSLVLEGFLSKVLPAWETTLPTLKSLLANSRHRAWKQWQAYQERYLEIENREALRRILTHPGAEAEAAAPAEKKAASKSSSSQKKKTTTSKTRRTKSTSTSKRTSQTKKSTDGADAEQDGAS